MKSIDLKTKDGFTESPCDLSGGSFYRSVSPESIEERTVMTLTTTPLCKLIVSDIACHVTNVYGHFTSLESEEKKDG